MVASVTDEGRRVSDIKVAVVYKGRSALDVNNDSCSPY